MKKLSLLVVIISLSMILSGCSTNPYPYYAETHRDLLKENWMYHLNFNPNHWVKGSGNWFLTGQPTRLEKMLSHRSPSTVATMTMIKPPYFDSIVINGNFHVQLLGGESYQNLAMAGGSASLRQIAVEVKAHTLYLTQLCEKQCGFSDVIVRIGIQQLHQLINLKSAHVAGRSISSDHLTIHSEGTGNIYLAGEHLNLARIVQIGSGNVTVLNANTPNLTLTVMGNGNVNVNGKLRIKHILHAGDGEVNIVGAVTDALSIDASGNGITNINGYANVNSISAGDNSRVYLYWARSVGLHVYESQHAHVGLAGTASSLHLNLTGTSRFDGSYLEGENVYAKTLEFAHANVTVRNKLFASATGNSSIYFYGSQQRISKEIEQYGMIAHVAR